ncbi:MAG TPA: DPP IV N-terminal domain-containing protein [Polyangiaceae bacterium]
MRPLVRLAPLALLGACAPAAPPPHVAPPPAAPPPELAHAESLQPSPYDPQVDLQQEREALRQIAETRSFRNGTPRHVSLTPDGKHVLFLRSRSRDPKQSLFEMDVDTGTTRELLTPESLLAGPESLSPEERVRRERMRITGTGFTSIDMSEDGARVLLVLSGRLFVLDRPTGKTHLLATGEGAAIDPRFSPDGTRVAYVRDEELRVIPVAGGREVQVTRGGSEKLTHGLAEFVAEEELDRNRGFWWSPDGTRFLYEAADTSHVDVLSISDPLHPEKAPQRIAYPRPGRPNAQVRFGIVSARGGPTTWAQVDFAKLPYVAHASWPKSGPPLLYALDRLQNEGSLFAIDPATGKAASLVTEQDAAWLNADPAVPRWLADGKGFLWSTERSGEWQLELRDPAGRLLGELLPKGFGYAEMADVDEKARTAVVLGSADPTETAEWLISLDGTAPPRRLAGTAGEAHAHFDASHSTFVSSEATTTTMWRWVVRSLDGKTEQAIPSTSEAPLRPPTVELAEVGPDRMRVAIVRPRGFRPDRRYAVIDAAYGGPHAQVVEQSESAYVRAQWMADATGAIVVAIDARGTPRRGRDWERAIFKKLGSVPVAGHVAALQALGAKYPEMDLSRVGVYGWSFGGYFAARAVLERPDVYLVAMAGAPPADWRDYDTAYTERYLGLPDEDAAAYDAASLLPLARKPVPSPDAARRLLLVHGTADDNVWFLNALKLADALERGGRPFEFMPLAGTTHMLLDPTLTEETWLRAADTLRNALRAKE